MRLSKSNISIITEKSADGSNLIIKSNNDNEDKADNPDNNTKLLEYQLAMLSHNRIPHILPIERRIKNGFLYLYYEVGSLVTLKQYIIGRSLHERDALVLLESLVRGLIESKYYFLYEQNYLLSPEYIYVDANNMSVKTVYLPYVLDCETKRQLAGFFWETLLLLDHRGRIAEALINEDKYNFSALLQDIKKQQFSEIILEEEQKDETEKKPFHLGEELSGESPQVSEDTVRVAGEREKGRISQGVIKISCFALIQTVIIGILSIFSGKLPVWGENMVTYVGIAIVLVAINVLVLYKCFIARADCAADADEFTDEERYQLVLEKMLVREKGVLKEELSLHKIDDRMTLSKQKQ